jgi:hypothetical protein
MKDVAAAEAVLWAECFKNWSVTGLPIPTPILRRRCRARFPTADADEVLRRIAQRMQSLLSEHRGRQACLR